MRLTILFLFISIASFGQMRNNQPKVFNVFAYGAKGDGTTDDTQPIQRANDACIDAGGGQVFFPYTPFGYKISGALQTSVSSVNPNCQIYFKLCQASSKNVSVKWVGEAPTAWGAESVGGGVVRSTQGVILFSTIQGSGTTPAVIGSPWYNAGVVSNRNYLEVAIENIEIRTQTKTAAGVDTLGTMSGINASKLLTFSYSDLNVTTSSAIDSSVEPTNNTYGLILPDIANHAKIDGNNIFIQGYKYGIQLTEHSFVDHLVTVGCVNAVKVIDGNHTATINKWSVEACRYNMSLEGTMPVTILDYETEHTPYSTAKWFINQFDIRQVSGTSRIQIFNSNVVEGGLGIVDSFKVSNSPDYYVFNGIGRNVYRWALGSIRQPLTSYTTSTTADQAVITMQNDVGLSHFQLFNNSYSIAAKRKALHITTDANQTAGISLTTSTTAPIEFRTNSTGIDAARLSISGAGTSNFTGNVTTNSGTVPSFAATGSLVVSTATGSSSLGSMIDIQLGTDGSTFGLYGMGLGSSAPTWMHGMNKLASDVASYTFYQNNFATPRFTLFSDGNTSIGTNTNNGFKLDVQGTVRATSTVTSTQYRLSALNAAPANASATGTTGEIRIDASFIYVCIATNTWVRAALATW